MSKLKSRKNAERKSNEERLEGCQQVSHIVLNIVFLFLVLNETG